MTVNPPALAIDDPIEFEPESPQFRYLFILGKLACLDERAERHWEQLATEIKRNEPDPDELEAAPAIECQFFCGCGAGFLKIHGLHMHRRLSRNPACLL